jgi:ribosomal protein L29
MKRAMEQTMDAGAKGIKIQLAGRLGGAEMARREKQISGSIPLSTLRADIDYGFTEAMTAQGILGYRFGLIEVCTREKHPMALMPKRVKHRKSQRGRIKGNATRGNRVVFGDFGLQALQGGWIKAQTIEAGSYRGPAVCAWRRSFVCAVIPAQIDHVDAFGNAYGKRQRGAGALGGHGQAWHGDVRIGRGNRRAGTRLFCPFGAQDADPRAIPAAASGLSGEWISDSTILSERGGGRATMKTDELCDMSDEQLTLTLNDTVENLFRLRMQAQTERLDAPSELRRNRRLVARIKTIQRQRELADERQANLEEKKES